MSGMVASVTRHFQIHGGVLQIPPPSGEIRAPEYAGGLAQVQSNPIPLLACSASIAA